MARKRKQDEEPPSESPAEGQPDAEQPAAEVETPPAAEAQTSADGEPQAAADKGATEPKLDAEETPAVEQTTAASSEPAAESAAEQAGESAPEPAAESEAAPAEPDAEPAAAAAQEPAPARARAPAAQSEAGAADKASVPGADLEVDIVPEGADPLATQALQEPYAEEVEPVAESDEEQEVEQHAEPIPVAAIDLAAGARYRATGKRKTAIARVILRPGKGTYKVNDKPLDDYFPRPTLRRNIRQPLEAVGYEARMDVVARLQGGGISAQAGALRHGISRALLEADPNLRGELKRRGFLTRDSRAKERKKAGLKKARKRPQFSKR